MILTFAKLIFELIKTYSLNKYYFNSALSIFCLLSFKFWIINNSYPTCPRFISVYMSVCCI